MAVTHYAHSLLLQSRELGDPFSEDTGHIVATNGTPRNTAVPGRKPCVGIVPAGCGALLIKNRECHLPSGGGGTLLDQPRSSNKRSSVSTSPSPPTAPLPVGEVLGVWGPEPSDSSGREQGWERRSLSLGLKLEW